MSTGTAGVVGALLLLGIGLTWACRSRAAPATHGVNAGAAVAVNPIQAQDVVQLRNDTTAQHQQQLQAV